ncbi:MAG: hypothetical protein KBB88_01095 [Candidatus Pacebacteria bacterium]|nr:hypothetical protein [Candidatus Paceibacterota bacterium]
MIENLSGEQSHSDSHPVEKKNYGVHVDARLVQFDTKKVFDTLPEIVKESDIGHAIAKALDELKKSEEGFDLMLLSDCIQRIAHYFDTVQKNDPETITIETTFVLGGVINNGKGAFLAPIDAYHPSDMVFYTDYNQIDESIKDANENKDKKTKYIRYDMSEDGKKIVNDIFHSMASGHVSLGQEAVYNEELATVKTSQENTHAFYTVVRISEEKIKDFIDDLHSL